jgi:hypothetical protein
LFNAGDIVLCANTNGSYMDFFTFDIVKQVITKSGSRDFMIALQRPRYKRLFDIEPYRAKLAELIRKNKICGKYVLHRSELGNILKH